MNIGDKGAVNIREHTGTAQTRFNGGFGARTGEHRSEAILCKMVKRDYV